MICVFGDIEGALAPVEAGLVGGTGGCQVGDGEDLIADVDQALK